jgi:hypothetical protein
MSDGSCGPYQSRLLNFISKQSRQVADKCDRTWREVKLASLNAVQILLYPAYLLVQGSRMLSRQLRESKQQIDLPELQEVGLDRENLTANLLELEVDADSPIAGILNLAQNLLLPEQTLAISESISHSISFEIEPSKKVVTPSGQAMQLSESIEIAQTIQPQTIQPQTIPVWGSQIAPTKTSNFAAIPTKPQVRGIATFLHDRNLVLVGNENQVLDILTPEQQQLLSGRIVWEVANSGTQRREIAQKELEFNLGVESAVAQAKLPPLKRFWELMAWVQTSPIALKRNQFGESILAVKQAVEKAVNAGNNSNLSLTQKHLLPASTISFNPAESNTNLDSKFDRTIDTPAFVTLLDRAATNIEAFSLPAVSKNTAGLTAAESGDLSTLSPSAKEILENYARRIENTIWSSVDYLLGKETAASDNTEKAVAIKYYLEREALKNAEETEKADDRPWLKWQDLFPEPAPPPTSDGSTAALETLALSQNIPKVKPEIEGIEALPEGRSASITPSPYPAAIQTLLAQLKQSLLTTKVPKNQPQKTAKLTIAQQHSPAPKAAPKTAATAQQQKPTGLAAAAKPATAISVTEAKTNGSGGTKPEADWLEAKAESIGYVKHPLEQALEWLDRIMVQLEKIAAQIWQWAKTRWLKAPSSKD